MYYSERVPESSSHLQNEIVFETSHRTVLPPTKRTAYSDNNKHPSVNAEIQFNTLQEEQHNQLSKASDLNQKRLLWTMPDRCEKLSSSKSPHHRIVLPKAQLDASGGQPQRRVILPEGKPKSSLLAMTTTDASKQSRQACEEELEFLKLKLRYMQNDIEFKKTQIDSAKTSQPKGSTTSQKWNINSQHISAQASPASSFSNSYLGQQTNLHPRPSATTWTAERHMKTKADIPEKNSHLQRTVLSSAVTTNYQSSKCNEFSVITKSNTLPMVTKSNNNISALYTWSSNLKDGTSSGALRPTSSPSDLKKVHSEYERVLPNHIGFTNQTNVAQNHSEPTQTQKTNCSASLYSASPNVLPYGSKTELPVSYPLSTAGPTTSAFERLDNQRHSKVHQVYISPDKRFVLLSSKAVPVEVPSMDLMQRTCRTVCFPAVAENYSTNNIPHKYNPGIQSISHFPHSETHFRKHSGKSGSTTSLSKYKLVKNSSLPIGMTMAPSSSFNSIISLSSHVDSTILHGCSSYLLPAKAAIPLRRTSQCSKFSLRSPNLKIQTAAKLVSKYKLKRLSPTSASLTAPLLFNSRTPCKKPTLIYEQQDLKHFDHYIKHRHKLDRRLMNNSTTSPTLMFKKPIGNIYNVLTKKHKIDRRPSFNQQLPSTKSSQSSFVRNMLKIDKRDKRSNIFQEKLGGDGIQNVHILDRRINNSHNSRFKWSSPDVQAQNGAWQQLRQKLQLMLNKKYRHSRFKFSKHPLMTATPSIYNRASKVGDYKTNLVTIDGIMYKSSRSKLTRTRRSSGGHSARKAMPVPNNRSAAALKCHSRQKRKLISVRGVHFNVDRSGKKLCRTDSAAPSASASARKISASSSDFNVVNFANRAIHRSKIITAAKYKKSNNKSKNEAPHCIFFGRFGKCHRGDKCPYVHDPDKVAVCTRFLRGKCDTADCPFSHKASPNKMPVCLFFLRGTCFRENCPYLHVRVNPNAPVCKDFRNGFCTLGEKCKKIHSHVCPSFAMTGTCSRAGTCIMLHRTSKREMEGPLPQAKSLSRKSKKQPQVDLRKFASESQELKFGTSIIAPTSKTTLKSQPSFISLESNPLPSFISLETNPKEGSEEIKMQPLCEKPELTRGKIGYSVLNLRQLSSTKDSAAQSIRPSFLAKKFIVDKTTEQSI